MLDFGALWQRCAALGLAHWQQALEPMLRERLNDAAHGNFAAWRRALECLQACDPAQHDEIRAALLSLAPWRKGPFTVAGITIDSEWRSDRKWERLQPHIAPLHGRKVLDIGCGNGYYALRMCAAGADTVLGVDPTLLYVMQFLAVTVLQPVDNVFVLPLRGEELPQDERRFDTCFSMGVLYHQRSPLDHLRLLRGMLRPGGQLVLETLYLPGDHACAFTPPDRYARMRNVWLLPTIPELRTWLRRSGFTAIEVVDESITTIDEQRSTEWMPFESLAAALDPADPARTVEGLPAPRRAVILAIAP
jgi:tRNA (mo5U34)-methyltransferase